MRGRRVGVSYRVSADPAGRQPALLEVALVVLLGAVEGRRRRDLGDDRPAEAPRRLAARLRGARRRLLRGGVEEDRRAVLRADVGALAVQLGRVVVLPEHVEQLLVGDARRVVLHLHGPGVAGAPGEDDVAGRVRGGPARTAAGGRGDAVQMPEPFLHSPEATAAEG